LFSSLHALPLLCVSIPFGVDTRAFASAPSSALVGHLPPPASMSKVHGSLARAGKVRGQTPKVAKQDKKKKPTGRAHKRMQYNRRFVTAVVGFGKKRGPNSSEK
jgi:small subunit ribosomal protein S30e